VTQKGQELGDGVADQTEGEVMRERMNHSPLIALVFCNLSPSAVQNLSHVRRCSCCALHVGVLFTLLRNLHMQSRRLGQPLLIESEDGRQLQ
jgi:hypothetical protein